MARAKIDRASEENIWTDGILHITKEFKLPVVQDIEFSPDQEPGTIALGPNGYLVYKTLQGESIELKPGNELDLTNWWYGGGADAWADIETAFLSIPTNKRYGLTIGVETPNGIVEYWWPKENELDDTDIVRKGNDLSSVYSRDEVDLLLEAIPVVTRTSLEITNVDNTSDLNKPISNATSAILDTKADKTELALNVSALQTLVEEVRSNVKTPFSEFKIFTYNGQPEIVINLTHTPTDPNFAYLYNEPLNAFWDYRYEGNKIILRTEQLTLNREYSLYISYFKQ